MADEARKLGKSAGNRGKGRPKGSVNKVTRLLKEDILDAAEAAHPEGRVGYLREQARENPTAFLTLLGKVLPTQLEGGVSLTVTLERDSENL